MAITLTREQLCELLNGNQYSSSSLNTSFRIGTAYLIRTVTHYYTGRLKAVTDTDLLLEDAAWIADTGRFHEALKSGSLNEIEPFTHDVIISRGAIVDATEWAFKLPRATR